MRAWLAAAAMLGWAASVQANDAGCTAATIKGAYALSGSGFQGTGADQVPVAVVRLALFDGVGGFRGEGWVAIGGAAQQFSSDGTYRVRRNCTVTMEGAITVGTVNRQFGVIVHGGRKIETIRTDPGQTIVLTYERVAD